MKIAIAGAGSVGRSIARELISNGHDVMLIDNEQRKITPVRIPEATWVLGDAAEVSNLEHANLSDRDVMVSATGDDKVNLVVSLLAKTEFSVIRVVARINHPSNEWLFTEAWGVDVAVSTPRVLAALVEEAVSVGDLVRLFSFRGGSTSLLEMTLPEGSPRVGIRVADLNLPGDAVLVAIIRDGAARAPERDAALEGEDELLFLAPPTCEASLAQYLMPRVDVNA